MSVYNDDNFMGRVNYASAVISRKGGKTRHFDTCFEMWDGDAVAAAVWNRAQNNAKIMANLPRYLNIDSIKEQAELYRGQNLNIVAAQLRAEAKKRYNIT